MKKLLLILIALPMIGFGQVDKIIFSSGDTIYGKVIEVGVNDITYQHKDETTNNVTKKRELAKVIYSSGRIETFQGLKDFQSIKEKNIIIQKKKDFKRSLELGFVTGITSSNYYGEYKEIVERVGGPGELKNLYSSNIGISLKYNITHQISFNSNLVYHIKGADMVGDVTFTDVFGNVTGTGETRTKTKDYYINLPIITKFNFNNDFSLNAGIYSSYLIKSVVEFTPGFEGTAGGITLSSDTVLINQANLDGYKRFDFGLVLGSGFSYALNNKIRFTFDANLEYGLINSFNLKNSNPRYNIGYNFQLGCSYRLKQ